MSISKHTSKWLLFIHVLIFFLSSLKAVATESDYPDTTADERQAVVERVSELLVDHYVFPDVAKDMATKVRTQLASGAYDELGNAKTFAKRITKDLRAISHDKHIGVGVRKPGSYSYAAQKQPHVDHSHTRKYNKSYKLKKAEYLEGNIGYLDFRVFAGHDDARTMIAGALAFLSGADAIIFDLRKNTGGSPKTVQFICSYFFAKKTHLDSVYWREGDRIEEFWTLDEVPGKRMPDVPIFILTSHSTFSGAEQFTYSLQARKRATVVGETTGGGAHPNGKFVVNDRFHIFIATGRGINPVTGTNWEGVGVKPDIEVSADRAFAEAYALAKKQIKR